MSTKHADNALEFHDTQGSLISTLLGPVGKVFQALAEGKAAADHYESLVARGMGAGEASQAVFRKHFGKR